MQMRLVQTVVHRSLFENRASHLFVSVEYSAGISLVEHANPLQRMAVSYYFDSISPIVVLQFISCAYGNGVKGH